MGVIGERWLQELIDHAEFEMRQGTPRDIASRAIFEKCAEALEETVKLEEERDKTQEKLDEYEYAVKDIRRRTNMLLDEDEDKSDPCPEDLTDVYEALAGKINELDVSVQDKDAQIKELSRMLDEERERSSALAARVRYLEAGLGRVLVEIFKLRKGVL